MRTSCFETPVAALLERWVGYRQWFCVNRLLMVKASPEGEGNGYKNEGDHDTHEFSPCLID